MLWELGNLLREVHFPFYTFHCLQTMHYWYLQIVHYLSLVHQLQELILRFIFIFDKILQWLLVDYCSSNHISGIPHDSPSISFQTTYTNTCTYCNTLFLHLTHYTATIWYSAGIIPLWSGRISNQFRHCFQDRGERISSSPHCRSPLLECHIGDIVWMLCRTLQRRLKAYYWNMTTRRKVEGCWCINDTWSLCRDQHWKMTRSKRVMVVHARWMNHLVNGSRNL